MTLHERSTDPFTEACSPYAGAMLAPRCEEESAEAVVRELGRRGIALWQETYPGTVDQRHARRGAASRPRRARSLRPHDAGLSAAVAGRAGRSSNPLSAIASPARSITPRKRISRRTPHSRFLLDAAHRRRRGTCASATAKLPQGADLVIDCRGLAAKDDLPTLRGVRGERIVVKSREVNLSRPVRLLHPRFPLYVVPWGDGVYMIGATVIESEETGPITLRSALDLLSAAYALDPAFAEAEIVRQGAGARPAFPDNRPRIIAANGYIYVNGLYRHGFLLAPALAELVAAYIETGATDPEVFLEHPAQR